MAAGTTRVSTAAVELTREDVESKPREEAEPELCTARIKEPSLNLLLNRESYWDWSVEEEEEEEEARFLRLEVNEVSVKLN